MFHRLKLLFMSCVLAILQACSASPGMESTGEFIDSTTITAKVKAQLLDHLGSSALPIQVKTFKDEVQLSGFVSSQSVKSRAGEIVARNPDVKRFRNDLIVK